MATLYIAEFQYLAGSSLPGLLAGREPVNAEQTVAIGVGSVQSAALSGGTRFVRLCADAACSYAIGANPTADATKRRLPANVIEWVEVLAAEKIAVITNT